MKKAFTLIELMIVIAVMAVLMSLVFKLTGLGGDAWRRAETISRLQRLENCLSGYYAAFGSYPPVKLHGSRDYTLQVDVHGIQKESANAGLWSGGEYWAWHQVQAACRAQPVAARFPFSDGNDARANHIRMMSAEMKRRAESGDEMFRKYWGDENVKKRLSAGFDDGVSVTGRFNGHEEDVDWRNVQIFMFGLMSFLTPRYQVMMHGPDGMFDTYAQWTENNAIPSDPYTGEGLKNWEQVRQMGGLGGDRQDESKKAQLMSIPSQAICARWMANLSGICKGGTTQILFGINVMDTTTRLAGSPVSVQNPYIELFTPRGHDSLAAQYVLDCLTVVDGWGSDFYYYSPRPYQRYILWSAGPNGRTFPPWVDRTSDSLKSGNAQKWISNWVADDIIHMKN